MADIDGDDGIWMEEDDYCQREILPLSSRSWCEAEIGKIGDFAAKHAIAVEPGLTVYSDMYVRGTCPAPLSSLGIPKVEFESLMQSFGFEKHRVVGFHIPDSTAVYRRASDEEGHYSDVFIDWVEGEVIQSIWLSGPLGREDSGLMSALTQLGQRYGLLYVDWGWGLVAALDGGPDLDTVTAALEEMRRQNRGGS